MWCQKVWLASTQRSVNPNSISGGKKGYFHQSLCSPLPHWRAPPDQPMYRQALHRFEKEGPSYILIDIGDVIELFPEVIRGY